MHDESKIKRTKYIESYKNKNAKNVTKQTQTKT